MNEYYGIATTPTDDYLAHYGVRGMKWGVRKARENRDSVSLSKHYNKALKKLTRLHDSANSESAKGHKRMAGIKAAAAGTLGAVAAVTRNPYARGVAAGYGVLNAMESGAHLYKSSKRAQAKAKQKEANWKKEMKSTFRGTKYAKLPGSNQIKKDSKARVKAAHGLNRATYFGGALGGLAYAARHKDQMKALNRKKRYY